MKCRTKELGMIHAILGSFCSFELGRGRYYAQIRPRKIPDKFNILSLI